ncbi:uncharacterized protein LOC127751030 isoform X2 [Frankliniella occidentalis]|uniref:Uncharacterized protein LOC127751030 isoform X2 n=1 Tax=Frankliniella occidentalis TaxID=133901 RepID=A0A9C6X647_FRAOC|nr:uncharacterized protein LOC127751030 isoform X2 [Frankliniella occidentalis]
MAAVGAGRPLAPLALTAALLLAQLCAGRGDPDAWDPSAVTPAAAGGASQMLLFREATARVLEAAHGWINCLLSARPRPPAEIVQCTEQALPLVGDVLAALSTAGWAIRYKSPDEVDGIRRIIQRIADIRTQVAPAAHQDTIPAPDAPRHAPWAALRGTARRAGAAAGGARKAPRPHA